MDSETDNTVDETYVLSLEETQRQLDWCSGQLVSHLTEAYGKPDDEATDGFIRWAADCAAGTPEVRWACLQACATFAKGMILRAGEDPLAVAQHFAPGGRLPQNDEDPDINAGITDALGILGVPGLPEEELGDEWLEYASDVCPADKYVAAVTFLFALALAAFPEAARQVQTEE